MKKTLLWGGLVIVMVLGGVIVQLTWRATKDTIKQETSSVSVEAYLAKTAEMLNRRVPIPIDENSRVEAVVNGPGKRFTYVVGLVKLNATEVDKKRFLEATDSGVRNRVCGTADMKTFFSNGVVVTYSYRGKDGGHIADVSITPRDCGYGT